MLFVCGMFEGSKGDDDGHVNASLAKGTRARVNSS